MKSLFLLLLCSLSFLISTAQTKPVGNQPDSTKNSLIVEAACGQCQFRLKGQGCSLAVRINGKAYFVDGTDIDSHGDAHAEDGFCNAIRKAEVQGAVVGGRFKTRYFRLVKQEAVQKL